MEWARLKLYDSLHCCFYLYSYSAIECLGCCGFYAYSKLQYAIRAAINTGSRRAYVWLILLEAFYAGVLLPSLHLHLQQSDRNCSSFYYFRNSLQLCDGVVAPSLLIYPITLMSSTYYERCSRLKHSHLEFSYQV